MTVSRSLGQRGLATILDGQDQLLPLDFVSPGFRGLNTVEQGMLMDPSYCIAATNAVIDVAGRLAARNGCTPVTTTHIAGTPSVLSAFEYNGGATTGFQTILAWNGGISNNPVTPTNNIGGSVTVTNGRWFFQNFNNKCIGLQAGQKPIVYTGTGTFATVVESAGTAPTGGIGCSAFGRLWVVQNDYQTIQYSGLLDETDWSTTDGNAGIIDMHTIWSDGTDQVTAIFAFNASLVVCGTKHIIFFTDGRGSMLGMDPTQAYVFDMLAGTGCISQWTVDKIGETDVVFLGPQGLQSLLRLTTNRNNPIETLSKYNRDLLLSQLTTETLSNVSGCYNNLTGFYILGLPVNGLTWCFDMRRLYQDDTGAQCSVTTQWSTAITACYSSKQQLQQLYLARAGKGTLCTYGNYLDEGTSYTFMYTSPWMTLGQQVAQRLKLLKRIELLLYTAGGEQFTLSWATDFGNSTGQVTQTVPALASSSLYGVALWGVGTYGSSGTGIYLYKYAAHIRGQYYQMGVVSPVTGALALQQAQFAAKIGRIA
jgi:hypothetical protein